MRHLIAYASSAGTTRRAAAMIRDGLAERGVEAEFFDLRRYTRGELPAADEPLCLWIGSPVYAQHPVPYCAAFIKALGAPEGSWCAPFVAWGGVSTGVALEELGQAALDAGYNLAGGARVLCAHSNLWREADRPHDDRPNAQDKALLAELAGTVVGRIEAGEPCDIESMRQRIPAVLEASPQMSMDKMRTMIPKPELDAAACIGCGLCAEECPAAAITLEGEPPLPHIGPACVRCRGCVRVCPEGAFLADMSGAPKHLASLIERFQEPAETTIY